MNNYTEFYQKIEGLSRLFKNTPIKVVLARLDVYSNDNQDLDNLLERVYTYQSKISEEDMNSLKNYFILSSIEE